MKTSITIFSAVRAFALAVILLATASSTATANDIRGIQVVSQADDEIRLAVHYTYHGTFGSSVYVGAKMANNGEASPHYAYGPSALRNGMGTTYVTLSTRDSAPDSFTTGQVKVFFYIGGSYVFLEETFSLRKTWKKPKEDCIPFKTDDVTLRYDGNGRFLLTDGRSRMQVFPNWQEAVQAYRIIRYYGMNYQCFVGRPDPSFEYWLVDGKAPEGAMPGEDSVRFNPKTIEVKYINNDWKIVDGNHWMFSFPNAQEAREALQIIKKYGFTHSCFVGRPDASMQYLRK